MRFNKIPKIIALVAVLSTLAETASADIISTVTLDTSPLAGHPAGPFSIFVIFIDGNGVGDGNNTVTISDVSFSGGRALGSPLVFGGANGSLDAGITISDTSFLSLFSEQFVAGPQLSFTLELTSNDNASGTPDRLTLSILDSFGVPLPTLAPAGDYFLGVDFGSGGPLIDAWGGDPARFPSIGNAVSIPAPDVAAVNPVPEASTLYLLGTCLLAIGLLKSLFPPPSPRSRRM